MFRLLSPERPQFLLIYWLPNPSFHHINVYQLNVQRRCLISWKLVFPQWRAWNAKKCASTKSWHDCKEEDVTCPSGMTDRCVKAYVKYGNLESYRISTVEEKSTAKRTKLPHVNTASRRSSWRYILILCLRGRLLQCWPSCQDQRHHVGGKRNSTAGFPKLTHDKNLATEVPVVAGSVVVQLNLLLILR